MFMQTVYLPPEQWQILVDRYRFALRVWRENQDVREAAILLGMSDREYCDRCVSGMPQLQWVPSGGDLSFRWNRETAWREARKAEGL